MLASITTIALFTFANAGWAETETATWPAVTTMAPLTPSATQPIEITSVLPSTTTVADTPATTHTVQVAPGGSLTYSIPVLNIKQGDSVIWNYAGKPHTVTQTGDGETCVPLAGGFNSDLLIAPNTFVQTFYTVGKTWYVCTVGTHCDQGMKGLINVLDKNAPLPSISATAPSSRVVTTSGTHAKSGAFVLTAIFAVLVL